jgi:hypothetical protein
MMTHPLLSLSALDLVRRMQSGAASATEVMQARLARIDALEPAVEAWASLNRESALAAAARADAARGPGIHSARSMDSRSASRTSSTPPIVRPNTAGSERSGRIADRTAKWCRSAPRRIAAARSLLADAATIRVRESICAF